MPRTLDSKFHIDNIVDQYGADLDADKVKAYCTNHEVGYQTITKYLNQFKTKRGHWKVTVKQAKAQLEKAIASPPVNVGLAKTTIQAENLVPTKDDTFIKFGAFPDLKKVIQSRLFYPVFITGMSGNGKTFGVEQACNQTNRELIRVNITVETDEDDLIGGFRLVNGETVWHNGPVIEALERGAILLLDEVDLASNKILCLQSILEGKGVFLKKIGEYIQPSAGFNIVATANTKGKGSDDGRFIGTNVLNEAFLERFPITIEQEYPTVGVETKILTKVSESLNIPMIGEHKDFITHLCNWAEIVRKTFNDGGVDEIISTRRLTHIIRAYSIFGNKMKAVEMCLNRFDDETKESFTQLYSKLDDTVDVTKSTQSVDS
tara:strand:+ start:719 stop:1846 length:1128 start_codon:yes stop_codon:yes gene_type:complete